MASKPPLFKPLPAVQPAPDTVSVQVDGAPVRMFRQASLAADIEAGQVVVGVVSFEDQGRSRVMLKNRGLMHVYADKATGRFLGAEWIGPCAENIAHTLAWAYQLGLTVPQMLEMPFYHPVVEEGLRTALRDAAAQLPSANLA